MQEYCVKI